MKDYTNEEFSKLSEEEKSRLFDIEREESDNERLHFEKIIYPSYSLDEKVKFWAGELHQSMRWSEEDGEDPYAVYTADWYKSTKEFEPDFDKIMDEVFSKYWGTGADWSKEEYLKRISSK
ncbi:hypothetical protein [Aquimarina algiphila]|uniref:hypothetical protein n=1 Tax=Aquimarina algiphila TaxID=2047982 RepID=UPI0023310CB3|nr:hypothetical protein [Aquimarina algiphila]